MGNLKTVHFHNPVLTGNIVVPGDKSISHRAVMIGSIAEGETRISGFLVGEDCLRTIEIFQQLGVSIERNGTDVCVKSPGIHKWTTPTTELYAGNSGTTARLLLGILASSGTTATITGDESLSSRPMKRVTNPLQLMGADIEGEQQNNLLPLVVKGRQLKAIDYKMPVASAQVKSAILFAGLHADGETSVTEETISRDHTERMLMHFGVDIRREGGQVRLNGGQLLAGKDVQVPGDISSAAFFMAAAAMVKGSSVTFNRIGLNPTRTGILDVLKAMGAKVDIEEQSSHVGEPFGTVQLSYNELKGIRIDGELIPRLIDEIPIIALLATQAHGKTVIRDAEELRVKETDRIAAVVAELKKLGATIEETEDGMIIEGPTKLQGGTVNSYGDHRIGMMAGIASLLSSAPITIEQASCIDISYPNFFEDLGKLVRGNA